MYRLGLKKLTCGVLMKTTRKIHVVIKKKCTIETHAFQLNTIQNQVNQKTC